MSTDTPAPKRSNDEIRQAMTTDLAELTDLPENVARTLIDATVDAGAAAARDFLRYCTAKHPATGEACQRTAGHPAAAPHITRRMMLWDVT